MTEDQLQMTVRVFGTAQDSIVDGPGLRYALFVQGCSHHCEGCHNAKSWPAEGGTLMTLGQILEQVHGNGLVRSVTLSGGEPFEQPEPLAVLAAQLKGEGYNLWSYSGYTYEQLQAMAAERPAVGELLAQLDVLVDGPFRKDLKSLGLLYRGSANQRLVDMPATLAAGEVVVWQPPAFEVQQPLEW
ncbi:anaerobic ribonucleoside-triphosphate reductase activating protein [Parvibacter caecicola]|uniref:Anaerobic ribonucleoside-triphosphate reductase-activating protein n=2 Tax=Parvibacter caecicola TaxID=747645 RepID=A0A7W5D481_9ACTN|nr:anaerobic ribonucleoside-triphosphate reductase activating protein [Parvibacter caecicola]MBB3172116.1 anaerobic ribonucleoside-triphosphate reductase activating protein [Parvibacter caecicola]MCR2041048.1 anaerobic ribonucleoside-triphosphate reductase activating protein [Parvibacter caecicola]